MKCPHCHSPFPLSWKRYFKGFLLKYECPSCERSSKAHITPKHALVTLLPPIIFFAIWTVIARFIFQSELWFLSGAVLTMIFGVIWDKRCMARRGTLHPKNRSTPDPAAE